MKITSFDMTQSECDVLEKEIRSQLAHTHQDADELARFWLEHRKHPRGYLFKMAVDQAIENLSIEGKLFTIHN